MSKIDFFRFMGLLNSAKIEILFGFVEDDISRYGI